MAYFPHTEPWKYTPKVPISFKMNLILLARLSVCVENLCVFVHATRTLNRTVIALPPQGLPAGTKSRMAREERTSFSG